MSLGYYAVKALREIAKEIGKKDWNFSLDPCGNDPSWTTTESPVYENSVNCKCSPSVCHVVGL